MRPSANLKGTDVEHYGRIGDAQLDLVPRLDQCNPGLDPVEYNVIIAMAIMPEKVGSIILADETRDQRELGMQVGRIIAISPVAFNYEQWPANRPPPQVGNLVWFARFAGGEFEGIDQKRYRLVKDKDIGAVIRDRPVLAEVSHAAA